MKHWEHPRGKSKAWLRIASHFFASPSELALSDREFRRLMHGVGGYIEFGSTPEIPERVFRAWTGGCNQRQLSKFLELGLIERTEDGKIRLAGPFEVISQGSRSQLDGTLGWTYLIQRGDNGPVKIGSTSSWPYARLAALQTGHDVLLRLVGVTQGLQVERVLHERFADRRLQGEWFDPSVLTEIDFYGVLPETGDE